MIIERHDLACSMIFKAIIITGFLGSCCVSMHTGSSKQLAMQNPQVPVTQPKRGLYQNGSASQTKIGLSPAVQMLYWKQKSNRLAMKGGGFSGVAGGN
jgi:hypothetical protein